MKQANVIVHEYAVVPNKSSKTSAAEQGAMIRRRQVRRLKLRRMTEGWDDSQGVKRLPLVGRKRLPQADLLTRMRPLSTFERPYSGAEKAAT